jgi:aryl-alcohol dehydrogenase-like predicted oxidoreductase
MATAFPGATWRPRWTRRCDGSAQAGKILYFGLSNFLGYQIQKYADLADAHGLIRPVSVQPQYSLLARAIEWEVGPACEAEGLSLLPRSPLASGWLTGKYRRGEPPAAGTRLSDQMDQGMRIWNERGHLERNWQVIDAVRKVAEGRGASMSKWRSPGRWSARRFVR